MAKGKKKAAKKHVVSGEIPPELENPENFVDGLGVRDACASCGELTDGGAVVRSTGQRVSLCSDHRNPEELAAALSLEPDLGEADGDAPPAPPGGDPPIAQ